MLTELVVAVSALVAVAVAEEVYSCGGFVRASVPLPLAGVAVRLYTPEGNLKYETDVAPNTGYYMLPVYQKGHYVVRLHPPVGWQFGTVAGALLRAFHENRALLLCRADAACTARRRRDGSVYARRGHQLHVQGLRRRRPRAQW